MGSSIDVCAHCHNSDSGFAAGHKGGRRGSDATKLDVCVDCHSPHAGFSKLLRRKREQDTCLQCHDRGEFSRLHVHGAVEKGCSACHDLHEGNIDALRGPQLNDVCLDCHKDAAMHTHPVGGEHNDPRTGQPLTCDSCYSPHSSDYEFNLKFDRKRDLCVQCHSAGTMRAH